MSDVREAALGLGVFGSMAVFLAWEFLGLPDEVWLAWAGVVVVCLIVATVNRD